MIKTYLLIAGILLGLVVSICGCGKKNSPEATNATTVTTPAGLQVTDLEVGTGAEAVNGSNVSIEYTGKLDDGKVFDATSRHNNEPLDFTVGAGGVIPGMDQGILGMKVGGTRNIVIPPDLGYGEDDMGAIPPNSTLHFKIKLVAIK